jgi:MFS superfamily sulfate permease-like transporter
LGGVTDLISKPVMTGFLFGLGMTIAIGQAPKVFGVNAGSGSFFPQLADLVDNLGSTQGLTLAVGAASIVLLLGLKRFAPGLPGTLLVLVLGIVVSAVFSLSDHGVDVVGKLPSALPDPSVPNVSAHDLVDVLPAAFGILLLSTEGLGVSRALAGERHYSIDANREFVGVGVSNLLAGLSTGFVQSGGSSQTAAAAGAGGKSQLATVFGAGLILLTGGFLTGVFKDLPQATLGAIVIVSVTGFFRVGELARFGRIRRSGLLLSGVALAGVLAFGVLPGLIVAAGLSLMLVIYRISRPSVGELARDPERGVWGRADRHPGWERVPGVLAVNVEGPLFYANSVHVKDALIRILNSADPKPATVVLELTESSDIDVQTLDTMAEFADELADEGIELVLTAVRVPVLELLRRSGLAEKVRVEPTLDAATGLDSLVR